MKEKILGIKLLEAGLQDADKKKHSLRDIGDTSLVLCGLFAEISVKKISDLSYYQNIGKVAYDQLDGMIPSVYDVDHFYRLISRQFDMAVALLCTYKKQGLERAPDRFVLQLNQNNPLNKKAV